MLAEGAIGDRVTSVTYTLRGQGGARGMEGAALPWRLDAAQSGGGLVMDVGCHVIDRIDYLLGPLSGVTGSASNRNSPNQQVEDYVEVRAGRVRLGGVREACERVARGGKRLLGEGRVAHVVHDALAVV